MITTVLLKLFAKPLLSLLVPAIAYVLTELYKKVHPPSWAAPLLPYVFAVLGAIVTGLADGIPLDTVLAGLVTGGAAVATYDLKKCISAFVDWLMRKLKSKDTLPPPPDVPPGLAPPPMPTPMDLPG
jgi:hypothetical protein